MAEPQDPLRVPGNVHGWGSAVFKIGEDRINGIVKIGGGQSRERTLGYGAGRHQAPTRRTAGKYGPKPCTMSLYKETAQTIRDRMAALAADGVSYGNTEVEITVVMTEPGQADLMVELERCTLDDEKFDHSEGPEGLMDEFEWQPMLYKMNGKTLADLTGGAP